MKFDVVSVVGLGYIGLPTAAVFASRKVRVVGVDICQATVDVVNGGGVHIIEPDLDVLVRAVVSTGYLSASISPVPADAFLIAVPTPFSEGNVPDLKYVQAAAISIAPVLKKGDLVILESTCPVGATEQMADWLAAARPDLTFPQQMADESDIRIAHCPERVLPGHVLRELVQNDRVIGGMTPSCSMRAEQLYKTFVEGECVTTDVRTAELCKLTENSFRDVNIAFANELSIICDKLGVNVWELIRLANRHPRVDILQPGPGVGGHCIAVDPWFIVSQAPQESQLIRTARQVNDSKPKWVCERADQLVREVADIAGKPISHVKIACFGLAFKADIDDLRESPALAITLDLGARYPGQVVAVEPHIDARPQALERAGVELVDFAGAATADVLVFLVDHKVFGGQTVELTVNQRALDTRGSVTLSVNK